MGRTALSMEQVRRIIQALSEEFQGRSYHLLLRNCNHFSDALCQALLRRPLPAFVNRVAYIGGCAACLVPVGWQQALQKAPVNADSNSQSIPQHRRSSAIIRAPQSGRPVNPTAHHSPMRASADQGFGGTGRRLGD